MCVVSGVSGGGGRGGKKEGRGEGGEGGEVKKKKYKSAWSVHKESISIAAMNVQEVVMECVIETKASMILQFING